MKRQVIAVLAVLVVTASVMAAPTVKLTSSSGSWPNTPYNADILQLNDSLWTTHGITSDFKTFCVESNVTFNPGGTYYATIDNVVKFGGKPALQDQAKQIYAAYLNGGNSIGSFTSNQIQSEIWYWQNGANYSVSGFQAKDQGIFSSLSAGITNGWQNVMVMNLWQTANFTGDVQSQMVMTSPVPAPGALLLGSIGISLVGYLRRRQSI